MASRRRIILIGLPLIALFATGCVSGTGNTVIRNVQQKGIWYALGALALAIIGFAVVMGMMALERKYQVLASLGLRSLILRIPVIGPQLSAGLQVQSSVMKGQSLKRQLTQDVKRSKSQKEEAKASTQEIDAKEKTAAARPEAEMEASDSATSAPPPAAAKPAAVMEPEGAADFHPPISRLPVPAEFISAAHLLNSAYDRPIIGKRLGRYQIEARHQRNNLGISYHAFDLKLGRPVCVTVLNANLTRDEAQQTELLEQVRYCSQLDHPVLPDIYDFELAEGHLFVVSEAINGQPLLQYWEQWRTAHKPIGYAEILSLLNQMLLALAYGEKLQLHHGNLTPDQLYFEPAQATRFGIGQLKMHNFGLWPAEALEANASIYCAPEGVTPATAQVDIYAIGTILYQLITGQAVDHDPTDPDSKLTAPADLRPGIPVDIEEIILDCLAREPKERPESIAVLSDLIAEVAASLGDKLMEESAIDAGEPVIRIRALGEPDRLMRLDRETFYLGKDGHNDLLLPGHGVAEVHARLDRGMAGWEISDLGSSHGTRLSDARLLPNLPESWLTSQTLYIGPYQLHLTTATEQELADEGDIISSIGVGLLPYQATVTPGERVDFQLSLINQGNQVDHFKLSVDGLAHEWVSVSDNQVELMPGAKGYLLVTVAPPRHSDSTAGDYPMSIRVHSTADPQNSRLVPGLLTVAEFEQLSFDLHPEHLTNQGKSRLQVTNQGNRPVHLNLGGRDHEDALHFDLPELENWQILPGHSGGYDIGVKAARRPTFGLHKRVQFDINVEANENRHFLPGQLVITPRLPSWMLAASGMALAFICLVLGFVGNILLLNRPVSLTAEVEATATALNTISENSAEADPLGTVAAANGMPASCTQIRAQNGVNGAADGEYTLYIDGDKSRPVKIYCHDMAQDAREFVTLATAEQGGNFSSIVYPSQELRTTYQKVRIDMQQLRIDPTDRTFAVSEGSVPDSNQRLINDFGSAIGCNQTTEAAVIGTANINLTGTDFVLAEELAFTFSGPEVIGNSEFAEGRAMATVTVSGNCGWVIPKTQIPLVYVGQS